MSATTITEKSMPTQVFSLPSDKTQNVDQIEKPKKPATYPQCKHSKAQKLLLHSETQMNLIDPAKDSVKISEVNKSTGDDVVFHSTTDFESFKEASSIVKDLEEQTIGKIFLTKDEKRDLEDITNIACKTRAPLEDRKMLYYLKDLENFTKSVTLPVVTAADGEICRAAAEFKQSESNIMFTQQNTLANYLNNLKNLIAQREITWAATTQNEYSQKAEVSRLKSEVNHLRVVCAKRQASIIEKNGVIAEKDRQVNKLLLTVKKLKSTIIQLEKDNARLDDEDLSQLSKRSTNLKGEEETTIAQRNEKIVRLPETSAPRVNQGPAALLANAIYKARNAGKLVNF